MSLYKWLVDYVFIPLGGSRTSPQRVYLNVLITMFISGLWHGAGLNFVVWGLWHGLLLAGHRLWRRMAGENSFTADNRMVPSPSPQPSSSGRASLHRQSCEISKNPDLCSTQANVPLLPEGEGWGEGE